MAMRRTEHGFTLVELMVVVLIIGVLVAIAFPVYQATKSQAMKKSCFANQRTIEGAVEVWVSKHAGTPAPLAGVLDSNHELVKEYILNFCPRCPAGDDPANRANPTVAEGAYVLDALGFVQPCPHRSHGHY